MAGDDGHAAHFRSLSDDELLRQLSPGRLADAASAVARAEAAARGLALPERLPEQDFPDDAYTGDFVTVARLLEPTEAHVLKAYFESCAIPAVVADAHLVQAHQLLSGALGGASVRVPEAYAGQAAELLQQFKEGQFELNEEAAQEIAPAPVEASVANAGLTTFCVYAHPGKEVAVVVKQGFSWGAFLFGPLWFLVHGMWLYFAIVAAFYVGGNLYFRHHVFRSAVDLPLFFAGFLLYLATWYFIGKVAHVLLGQALEDRGYKLQATVRARTASYAREAARTQRP